MTTKKTKRMKLQLPPAAAMKGSIVQRRLWGLWMLQVYTIYTLSLSLSCTAAVSAAVQSSKESNNLDETATVKRSDLSSSSTTSSTKSSESSSSSQHSVSPSWEALDARPLPGWYDDAKFGIFLHWGVFSVPSFGSEWFWYYWRDQHRTEFEDFVHLMERPNFSYQEYSTRFTAELYRPEEWVKEIFAPSGAQYVVLTSKHHEGFCLWNVSNEIPYTWNWNAVDVGPKRDLVGDVATQVKRAKSPQTNHALKFGLYHSTFEWFNPLFLNDLKNHWHTQDFVNLKSLPELYDLVNKYEPEIIWSDGEYAYSEYWKAREFLHWYATDSPVADTAVWNDRWGNDTMCQHGAFLTCADRYQPNSQQFKKWESALTIDKTSWGLNRNASYSDYMTVKELIDTLIQTISLNGNMLLNIGPGADGTINPIFVDRLRGMGDWLTVNGEAVYATRPWSVCQKENATTTQQRQETEPSPQQPFIYYVRKSDRLYVHITKWPAGNVLELHCPVPTNRTQVRFVGLDSHATQKSSSEERRLKKGEDYQQQQQQQQLAWWRKNLANDDDNDENTNNNNNQQSPAAMVIQLPALTPNVIPCQHAWVLEITGLLNVDDS